VNEAVLKNLRCLYNDCYSRLLAIVNQNDPVFLNQPLSEEMHSASGTLIAVEFFSQVRKPS